MKSIAALRVHTKRGWEYAYFFLGERYGQGKGVECNIVEAVARYTQAANKGYKKAQLKLAEMYRAGQGVPKDRLQAIHWSGIAAVQVESGP